jgi:murein DD-endopeptidase MepM/ murein hydrolase activator NlpD
MSRKSRAARASLGAALFLFGAATAGAQKPVVTATPSNPAPGSLVRIRVTVPNTDSALAVTGSMSGEPLHFVLRGGSWSAIGPVSVDATDSVPARVAVARLSGVVDSVISYVKLPPRPRPAAGGGRRRLNVDSRFTRPLDEETQARIDRENARAREVGKNAHSTEAMWTSAFINPRPSAITSRFGSGRMFNGTLSSRHLGVDFSGATGSEVKAANRGIVALVDEFFLAGNVVYIDHGAGLVTGYFHLSQALVAPGDTVERGQRIGLVGATGRTTGPHLHWNARYGAVTVNPLDLVRLGTP